MLENKNIFVEELIKFIFFVNCSNKSHSTTFFNANLRKTIMHIVNIINMSDYFKKFINLYKYKIQKSFKETLVDRPKMMVTASFE